MIRKYGTDNNKEEHVAKRIIIITIENLQMQN